MELRATSPTPRIPLVDLGAQKAALGNALKEACLDALERDDHILGQAVGEFEHEFADYCGARHAIAVDSGSSALELALLAHGIGPGDEVITAANTFVATAFAISHAGATPVLVDADPATATIDPALLSAAITPRTRAIMPVHIYGQPAEMTAIQRVADAHHLVVIEDACQAHGARDRDRRTGTLGSAGAFSFYPGKNLGAFGDGGMVVTGDDLVARRLRSLRNYGQARRYTSEVIGFNRRLDTIQAAMLQVKLPHLDGWNCDRRRHAERYCQLLDPDLVGLPAARPGVEHVWHLFVVRVPNRDRVRERLATTGIETGIHYPVPVHLQPAYAHLGYGRGDFPVSERLADEILSLPMYPELRDDAIELVVDVLHEAIEAEETAVA